MGAVARNAAARRKEIEPLGAAARACTHRRHSLNLFWAPWSWAKDVVRCSSSSSNCFLTWASCWGSSVSRLTVRAEVSGGIHGGVANTVRKRTHLLFSRHGASSLDSSW